MLLVCQDMTTHARHFNRSVICRYPCFLGPYLVWVQIDFLGDILKFHWLTLSAYQLLMSTAVQYQSSVRIYFSVVIAVGDNNFLYLYFII